MPITNLFANYAYRTDLSDQPIVIIVHGWDSQAYSIPVVDRYASSGLFACAVGMRGRNGADGSRDVSAREIYDIYDALLYIRSHFSSYVSADKAIILGTSGGGGNALAAACKFPDAFSVIVDCFGMSDYGRDPVDSWYQNCNSGTYQANMVTGVGGDPTQKPDQYYARDATAAITNYSGGQLIIFHDHDDTVVPIVHSTRIKAALDATDLHESISTDAVRWSHGFSLDGGAIAQADNIWIPAAKSQPAWTIPASGTITVIGYIVTKRFTIWLNSGLDAAATVVYDTVAGTYTVMPLTSNAVVAVSITQGALTASGNTNGETLFTVA